MKAKVQGLKAKIAKSTVGNAEDEVNLAVQIGRLTLQNPVMVASGTFGYASNTRNS